MVIQCFYQLQRIKNCRALPRDAVMTLANSFVTSCVDSCNCLLAGTPVLTTNKLQRVLNAAAKVIYGGRKFDHVTLLLRDKLHWLTIPERITYKLCLLTYKALHGLAPQYLADLCQPLSEIASRLAWTTCSATRRLAPAALPDFKCLTHISINSTSM